MALDARGGGERARSDADGRKSGVARGGALQNDDDNVYRPVGGRARSSAQAKDALPCSPAGDENDKDPRERPLCGSAIFCDSRRALWQWRKRDATRAQACADNIDRSCQRHPSCLSRGLPTRLPSLFLAASLAGMWETFAVEAAFTPRTRAELQGDGTTGGGGVFGCVGACGQSLSGSSGNTYCYHSGGAWHSGNGVCANANSDVPSDQGTGKYGAIESWDVSRVQSMVNSECVCDASFEERIRVALRRGCPVLASSPSR